MLIARYAGLASGPLGSDIIDLNLVPLFETIDDLRNAPNILKVYCSVPISTLNERIQFSTRGNARLF